MRKINAFLSLEILVLFLVHGIMGGFQLCGVIAGGNSVLTVLSWLMIVSVCVHAVIGIKLTADTLYARKMTGNSYFRENRLFWARRISGFAVMLFIVIHTMLFMGKGSGSSYRLSYFGILQLITQILMIISVAIHVICNIRPLFISFGVKGFRELLKDILVILAFVMLFTGAAMVIYYLRWNIIWR